MVWALSCQEAWGFPGPGMQPMSLALAGEFLTNGSPGKSSSILFCALVGLTTKREKPGDVKFFLPKMNCPLVQLKFQMSNLYMCHMFSFPDCEVGSLASTLSTEAEMKRH